jgi:hypothetical protein
MSDDHASDEPTTQQESWGILPALALLFPPLFRVGGKNLDWLSPSVVVPELRRAFGRYKRFYLISIGIGVLITPAEMSWIGLVPHIAAIVWGATAALDIPVQWIAFDSIRGLAMMAWVAGVVFAVDKPAQTATATTTGGGSTGATSETGGLPDLREAAETGYALPLAANKGARRAALGVRNDLSIGCIGGTGSGKTNTMELFASQFHPQHPVIALDAKDDYQQFFRRWDRKRELHYIAPDGSSHIWNLFAECDTERDLDQIARLLFPAKGDDYFRNAARQVFAGCCKAIWRDAQNAGKIPTNKEISDFFKTTSLEDAHEVLSSHDDLTAAADAIDPDADKQARGVWSTCQTEVSDVFTGDFAKRGEWSITDSVTARDGRAVVLDLPQSQAEVVGPIYRLLLDLAAAEALDSSSHEQYFILDEFASLPKLQKVERLVNLGRGQSATAFVGLQSVDQLISTYGRADADSLISGLSQLVLHRPEDQDSMQLIQDSIGERREWVESYTESLDGGSTTEKQVERNPIPSESLQNMGTGEAIVVGTEYWRRAQVAESTPELNDDLRKIAQDTYHA